MQNIVPPGIPDVAWSRSVAKRDRAIVAHAMLLEFIHSVHRREFDSRELTVRLWNDVRLANENADAELAAMLVAAVDFVESVQ